MEKPILKNEIEAKITTIGKVEDNISDAKEYALQLKDYYSKLVFTEKQMSEAKEERANINKATKKIAEYRKSIVAEFKKPIEAFEATAKETEKILKETADFVDNQVKEFENKEKELKIKKIEEIYNKQIEELGDIVNINQLFNDKWLNKGTSLQSIEEEIETKLDNIRNGLKAIEELHSEFELELKNTYLQDFDLSKAIIKNNQLQEQKLKLSKVEEQKEEIVQQKVETMLNKEVEEDITDPILTYTLKITASASKLQSLRKFMELNNIKFEKVETKQCI